MHEGYSDFVEFSRDDAGSYEGSIIQRYGRRVFPEWISDEMLNLVSSNGFNPLSCDEIEKYLPTRGSRIVHDENGNTVCWWTQSRVSDGFALYMYADGDLTAHRMHNRYYFAPACWLEARD